MSTYEIITKKKRGEKLSREEIFDFISGYTSDQIPDYQASALLMAICWRGLSDEETRHLTEAIVKSGDEIDLSEFGVLTVDKHSTGGVGDKTTLIVAPLAAALGCKVAKMSGRGLGHTGGTIDKLESIPGYTVALSPEEFRSQVDKIGVCVVSQTGNLAPADKKLYALRDVTATVDSIPLIASSVMSKKLAAGAHSIVLDVKCGSGAFVKNADDAVSLAEKMVAIGNLSGRNVAALITDMDTPLGFAIGNILEVNEAISVLRGKGPSDLTEICISLTAAMAHLALKIPYEEAKKRAESAIHSGAAFAKFKEWIIAQGADEAFVDHPEKEIKAAYRYEIKATKDGYVSKMDAELIGIAAMELGAGRKTKDDRIDFSAGIILEKKTGDSIKVGDTLATFYTNNKSSLKHAEEIFASAISFSAARGEKNPLIYNVITNEKY